MATAQSRLMTADELWMLGGEGDRYDLIEGELHCMSPASPKHGSVVHEFSTSLGIYLRANRIGAGYGAESGFRIARDPDTVLAPDAAFVRTEKIPPLGEQDGFWDVVPDLVLEVISPSDTVRYLVDKIEAYLQSGVSVVLTVDLPRRSLSVHTQDGVSRMLREADVLELPDILPGFSLRVGDIFLQIDPRLPEA